MPHACGMKSCCLCVFVESFLSLCFENSSTLFPVWLRYRLGSSPASACLSWRASRLITHHTSNMITVRGRKTIHPSASAAPRRPLPPAGPPAPSSSPDAYASINSPHGCSCFYMTNGCKCLRRVLVCLRGSDGVGRCRKSRDLPYLYHRLRYRGTILLISQIALPY